MHWSRFQDYIKKSATVCDQAGKPDSAFSPSESSHMCLDWMVVLKPYQNKKGQKHCK